jgi:hypothetical protein
MRGHHDVHSTGILNSASWAVARPASPGQVSRDKTPIELRQAILLLFIDDPVSLDILFLTAE